MAETVTKLPIKHEKSAAPSSTELWQPFESLRGEIEKRRAQRAPWLLVDIPETRPGAEVGLYYVLEGQRRQLRKDEKVAGSTQASEVWEQYAGSLLEAAGKIRIFCDPLLVDAVEALIPWENGIETLIESLEAVK